MVNDAFLLAMSADEFQAIVEAALRNYVDDPVALAHSSLAQNSLICDCLLSGEKVNSDLQTLGMRATIEWAVGRLRPLVQANPLESQGRGYSILSEVYLKGNTFEEVAERMALSLRAVYDIRKEALAQVTQIIRRELASATDQEKRKKIAIKQRYQRHSESEQQLLRMLSAYTSSLSIPDALELAERAKIVGPLTALDHLIGGGLLLQQQVELIVVHAEVRPPLILWTDGDEARRWDELSGEYYANGGDYILAASQWRKAKQPMRAAALLIDNYRRLVDEGHCAAFYDLQEQFRREELDDPTWARLKIAAGQAAMVVEDFSTAVSYFGEALTTHDILLKAQALYYRAKAYQTIRVEDAQTHFDRGIELLAEAKLLPSIELHKLQMDLHIGRAWLNMEELVDLDAAEADLSKAQELVGNGDFEAKAALHNAWAWLCDRRSNFEEKLVHCRKAWMSATESHNQQLILMTSVNLGQTYVWQNQIEKGFERLQEALFIAQELTDLRYVGKCHQAIGVGHYFQGCYPLAIEHYRQAYDAYTQAQHRNWLGWSCHDLVEAYLKLGELKLAQRYFREAQSINRQLGAKDLDDALQQLATKNPQLTTSLNVRQQLALKSLADCNMITNRGYQELTGAKPRTATRDLDELVDAGILVMQGSGRGARYQHSGNHIGA